MGNQPVDQLETPLTNLAPVPRPMILDIPKIEPEDNRITVLLRGFPGDGKSHLSHSFPSPIFSVYADPNRRTITDLMRAGQKIDARNVTRWDQFANQILPAVKNRQIPAETLVVDTIDFLHEMLLRHIKGSRVGLTQADWGTVLDKSIEAANTFTEVAAPLRDKSGKVIHPGYNIVWCCHLKKTTDEQGNVTEIAPAIKGAFRDAIGACFDVNLTCEAGIKTTPMQGGPAQKRRVYYLHSIPGSSAEKCKSTANWPPTITIEAGQNGYDLLKEFWNPTPTGLGAQTIGTQTSTTETPGGSQPQE